MLVSTINSGDYALTAIIGSRYAPADTVHHNGDDAETWDGSNDWDEDVPEKWFLLIQGGDEVEVSKDVFDEVQTHLNP